jgi:hypothetical protein
VRRVFTGEQAFEAVRITELVHGSNGIGRTSLVSKSHTRGLKISHSLQVSLVIGCTELAVAAAFTTDSRGQPGAAQQVVGEAALCETPRISVMSMVGLRLKLCTDLARDGEDCRKISNPGMPG